MNPEEQRPRLEAWLAGQSGSAEVSLEGMEKLSGGAIQENWAVTAVFSSGPMAGTRDLVLRTDAPASVSASLGRAEEFALLRAAFRAGVSVPEPLWLCADSTLLGRPFFVMGRVAGIAAGFRVVKAPVDGAALLARLGKELARIHTIVPPHEGLGFLEVPEQSPAGRDIARYRADLDAFRAPHPVLEWGLRWLEENAPPVTEIVLTHRDFRTGNYMLDGDEVTGILDWEFAAWGDPMSDLGWFCAKCWRFGANDREAGGVGDRADFYRAYEAESGRTVDEQSVHYWEVMAHVRWAVIAVQQGDRFVRDGERNLEAALTAHVVPELELEILNMTGEGLS